MSLHSRPPVITLLLVAGNLFAAFAVLLNPDLVAQFGFDAKAPELRDYFTSLFIHQNVLHLLGNMLFLAAVGSAVEMATGWLRYAVVYFLSGFAGLILHYFMARGLPGAGVYIGASGCVAGCIGYYALRYQAVRVPVVPRLALPILVLIFAWLGLQLVGALVRIGDTGGTAYWAHLGGFGMGVLLSLVFRTPDFGQREVSRQTIEQMSVRGPAALKIAAERHLKSYPTDPHALTELATACRGLADVEGETQALLQLLMVAPSQQHETVTRLQELGRLRDIPLLERARLAVQFEQQDCALANDVHASVLADSTGDSRADALLAYITFARGYDQELANNLMTDMERDFPLSPATEVARKRGWLP